MICFFIILATLPFNYGYTSKAQVRLHERFQKSSLKMSSVDFRVHSTVLPDLKQLSTDTLAGKIEHELMKKFGYERIERVIKSWRLSEQGYEHREFLINSAKKDADESLAYQYAPSYMPGLTCKTFWSVDDYAWSEKLKNSFQIILDEFKSVTNKMKSAQQEENNIWVESMKNHAVGWSTLVLMNRGTWDANNCKLFPRTAKCILDSKIPAVEVFFASMKPKSVIKTHSDHCNFVITSHLALEIPENGTNKCRINVGDDCRQWMNGHMLLFDTSIMHDAINETDSPRYILMIRLWHPDLTKDEINALQLIYDCLEVPELLSDDRKVQQMAQKSVRHLRSFPETHGEEVGVGFGKNAKNRKK